MRKQTGIDLIAEIGQAHDGKIDRAHRFIDAVAKTGAHAVKFQTHIASAESTLREPFRVSPKKRMDHTRYDYWKRMEFSPAQWQSLADHAGEAGLEFLSTPFSEEAVDLLETIGMKRWKIGSGEVNTWPLLERIARTRKPVILSSGMSSFRDTERAVKFFRNKRIGVSVLQCVSKYPAGPKDIGLNVMLEFQRRFRCPVGLSDHSGSIFPPLAAASLGASIIEVHVIFDRKDKGFDARASLTVDELATLAEGLRWIEAMRAHPVDKDKTAKALGGLKKIFCKSIVARSDLAEGTVLSKKHLDYKKPGNGLLTEQIPFVLGKTLKVAKRRDDLILKKDLIARQPQEIATSR